MNPAGAIVRSSTPFIERSWRQGDGSIYFKNCAFFVRGEKEKPHNIVGFHKIRARAPFALLNNALKWCIVFI